MSDATGGHVYKVGRNHSLNDVFQELQEEMRSQYSIGFSSTNEKRDGSYRKLEVRMANKDLKAQVRKGYYAVKPEARLAAPVAPAVLQPVFSPRACEMQITGGKTAGVTKSVLPANPLGEPLEGGFQRDDPIRAEELNADFDSGAPPPG
jgi:hypothetical protein